MKKKQPTLPPPSQLDSGKSGDNKWPPGYTGKSEPRLTLGIKDKKRQLRVQICCDWIS